MAMNPGKDTPMYIEENYIKDQFTQNFLNKDFPSIILYGTGLNTKRLLENVIDTRIAGLMDAKRTGEVLWGYKVLSYEEAAQMKDCVIIVIARNAVINVIYRRIESFCKENGIRVYNIQGEELGGVSGESISHTCFTQSRQALEDVIKEHDIISFDIFDTLLMRRIMRPRDIFSVMDVILKDKNYRFSEERVKAEDFYPRGSNPTIDMIYDRFQENTGITDEEKKLLLDLEIRTEKKFLARRESMCELLEWVIAQGKKVYFVSDMYFTKSILEEILKGFRIEGYQALLVSCEYGKGKQGGLFEEYINLAETEDAKAVTQESGEQQEIRKTKKYLHIGDNEYSDILAAQAAGIDAFRIYGAFEMFESSIYAGSLQNCNSLEENIVLSCFAEMAYNDPFRECMADGKLIIENAEELTQLFIAPVIYKYVLWLAQNVWKDGNDFVLFPSRDGYLIQKIYEKIRKRNPKITLPDSAYLYTSRRSAMIAATQDENDIKRIAEFIFVQDKVALFRERFGLDVSAYPDINDLSLEQLLERCMEEILRNCEEEGERYHSYLDGLDIGNYTKIAFMDFVAMGTVQEALEHMIGKPLEGYYFLKREGERESLERLQCHSLYPQAGDFQISANIYKYYYFLEAVITSYEPTFWGINADGEKEFYSEKRSEDTIELLKRIHKEILVYADKMLELIPDISAAASGVELYDILLGYFSADYSELKTEEMNQLINIDEFMGKKVVELNR